MIDYISKINAYGKGLNEQDRSIAKNLFETLIKKGWNVEQIYHGIRLLRGRSITRYKGLFYYDDFKREIKEEIKNFHEYLIDKSQEEKATILSGQLHYSRQLIPQEYYSRIEEIDGFLWGDATKHFTKQELNDEVNFLYEKVIIEPVLNLHCSFEEWLSPPFGYYQKKKCNPARNTIISDCGIDLGY